MYDYIVDSFAGVLTKGDVVALFNELVDHYSGNRSRAAREIGVTPATTYGWQDVNYIKHDTKKKVLKAIFEHRHLVAFEYLLGRASDKQTDILRTVLIDLFNKAIVAEEPEEFREVYLKYEEIRTHFRGTIRDHIEEEVSEMNYSIGERADELGVTIFEPSIDDLTARNLIDTLPLIVMEYRTNLSNPAEAARNLRLPIESVQTFWSTFGSMGTPRPLKRNVGSQDEVFECGVNTQYTYLGYTGVKHQLLGIMASALGTLVMTRPLEVSRAFPERYQEDASSELGFRQVICTGFGDSYNT